MNKLYFVIIASFTSQETLNELETKVISEDNGIINNIPIEKDPVRNKFYRAFKILICIFVGLFVFYFIYFYLKKDKLQPHGSQKKEQAEIDSEEQEGKNIKSFFLIPHYKDSFQLTIKRVGLEVCDDFFNDFFAYSEWRDLLKLFLDKNPRDPTEKQIEINYYSMLNFVKQEKLYFFYDYKVCYFDNGKFHEINFKNFDEKKKQIISLNPLFSNRENFYNLTYFFQERIAESLKANIEIIKKPQLTNINEFIIETLKSLPKIDDLQAELKYEFFSQNIESLKGYCLYKRKSYNFNDGFIKFFGLVFSYIRNKYNKSFLIKQTEPNQNDQIPIEVSNANIELAKENLKNLCFFFYFTQEDLYLVTTFGRKMDTEIYNNHIEKQEEKIKEHLEKEYQENQEYNLSWEEIIVFLQKCLLTKEEVGL